MKEYKVIRIKCKTKLFVCTDLEKVMEEELNNYSRKGWNFEQFSIQDEGTYVIVVLSKPKMM